MTPGWPGVRADGQRWLYTLEPAPLAEPDAWLLPYRGFWAQRLEALGTEIRRARAGRKTNDPAR